VNTHEVLRSVVHARDRLDAATEMVSRARPTTATGERLHAVAWDLTGVSVAAGGLAKRLGDLAGELEVQLSVLRLGCINARNAVEDAAGADRVSDALLEEAVAALETAATLLGAAGSAAVS